MRNSFTLCLVTIFCLIGSACTPLVPKSSKVKVTSAEAADRARQYLAKNGAELATLHNLTEDEENYYFNVRIPVNELSTVKRTVRVNKYSGRVSRVREE